LAPPFPPKKRPNAAARLPAAPPIHTQHTNQKNRPPHLLTMLSSSSMDPMR
jgi:hypothetical protein